MAGAHRIESTEQESASGGGAGMNLVQLAKSDKIVRDVAATASIPCFKTCSDDMKASTEKRRPCGIPAEPFRIVDKKPRMTTAAWSCWKKSSSAAVLDPLPRAE